MILKKLLLIGALASGLFLAACGTDGTTPTGTTKPITTGNATVDQAIAATVSLCGYLPSATTVAGVITSVTGGGVFVDVGSAVATSICNALVTKSAGRAGARVGAVRITGRVVDQARFRGYVRR